MIVTGAPPTIFRTPTGGYSKFAIRKIIWPERKPSPSCAAFVEDHKSGRSTVICIRGWMTKMAVETRHRRCTGDRTKRFPAAHRNAPSSSSPRRLKPTIESPKMFSPRPGYGGSRDLVENLIATGGRFASQGGQAAMGADHSRGGCRAGGCVIRRMRGWDRRSIPAASDYPACAFDGHRERYVSLWCRSSAPSRALWWMGGTSQLLAYGAAALLCFVRTPPSSFGRISAGD